MREIQLLTEHQPKSAFRLNRKLVLRPTEGEQMIIAGTHDSGKCFYRKGFRFSS